MWYDCSMQENIRSWLHSRGITNAIIERFSITTTTHQQLGEDAIVIPVYDYDGTHLFNKYRRSPFAEHPQLPKYVYDKGSKTALYGAHDLSHAARIVVTEGEMDTLVLRSLNITAVSSTGGALSFQEHFATSFLPEDDIYLCFDNDDAGADGMVKTLRYLPNAKVVFIPEQPGVKDISDFVGRGGDFHQLLHTAFLPTGLSTVEADRQRRAAQWLPVRFHDAYIKEHTPVPPKREASASYSDPNDPQKARAKSYPCDKILAFTRRTALCPVHQEKTPSLHYYPKTNTCHCFGCKKSFDSIALYQAVHGCDFKTALNALANAND